MEVVWNEVYMLPDQDLKSHLEEVKRVFDTLIHLDHANLVKFHTYWIVNGNNLNDRKKVVFITEYMSSGSFKQFLYKAKNKPKTLDINNKKKTLKAWKRWCTQILSALSYLHSCEPPIIHGNLTCDTIFIQHNGLIKIGSVAPDAITKNVKTTRRDIKKNMHYFPAECDRAENVTTAVDIYSFGICALEMAALELQPNVENGVVTDDVIRNVLNSLEDKDQRAFISLCLDEDPERRPTARELLFNKVLFEVHSLKLLAAHAVVNSSNEQNIQEEVWKRDPNCVIAEWSKLPNGFVQQWKVSDSPALELDKFLEDVQNGIYPLTAFTDSVNIAPARTRAASPEIPESVKSESPEIVQDRETRSCQIVTCDVKPVDVVKETQLPGGGDEGEKRKFQVHLLLKMEDKTNRDLLGEIGENETANILVKELMDLGFISLTDHDKVLMSLEQALDKIDAPLNTT